MTEPRQTFMGVPVVSEEEIRAHADSGHKTIYIVNRVTDAAPYDDFMSPQLRARRFKDTCECCSEPVWIDPLAYNPLQGTGTIVCLVCFGAKTEEELQELVR